MKSKDRLDSWKEIAEYINRDVRTCIKWEQKHDLPIYRVDKKSQRSPVFSYKSEIENWFKTKTK